MCEYYQEAWSWLSKELSRGFDSPFFKDFWVERVMKGGLGREEKECF